MSSSGDRFFDTDPLRVRLRYTVDAVIVGVFSRLFYGRYTDLSHHGVDPGNQADRVRLGRGLENSPDPGVHGSLFVVLVEPMEHDSERLLVLGR